MAAYVLVGLFLVNFALFGRHVIAAGDAAIETEAGDRPSEETLAVMTASRPTLFLWINVAILVAIILDMVMQPF